MNKKDILSYNMQELSNELENMNEPTYRAKQIFAWLHKKNAASFDDMTDISKALRQKLYENYVLKPLVLREKIISVQDNTTKYLFETENNTIIESVLMKYSYGFSACVSSQAGCRMGCLFCASAIGGLDRNLFASEILEQVYAMSKDSGQNISHVVIMGSGEPLDNYGNVLKFIKILNSKEGLNIGQRHITLSTCGLVDKIYNLAKEELQITLALSLHAPNDEIRRRIMPVANKYSCKDLFAAAKFYADKTGRRLTYEYALIDSLNDSKTCAQELAQNIKGSLCHVNLIPINDVAENNLKKSSKEKIKDFAKILMDSGIETTIRREMGSDISAACGQLRNCRLTK